MRITAKPPVVLISPPEYVELRQVCRIVQQLVHPVDDVSRPMPQHRVGQRLDDHLRTNARRLAHGDRDGRSVIHWHDRAASLPPLSSSPIATAVQATIRSSCSKYPSPN